MEQLINTITLVFGLDICIIFENLNGGKMAQDLLNFFGFSMRDVSFFIKQEPKLLQTLGFPYHRNVPLRDNGPIKARQVTATFNDTSNTDDEVVVIDVTTSHQSDTHHHFGGFGGGRFGGGGASGSYGDDTDQNTADQAPSQEEENKPSFLATLFTSFGSSGGGSSGSDDNDTSDNNDDSDSGGCDGDDRHRFPGSKSARPFKKFRPGHF